MDPGTLASEMVALLTPFLAKGGEALVSAVGADVHDAVAKKVGDLYRAVKEKLSGDDHGHHVLKRVEELPTDVHRQNTLKAVLVERLVEDPAFQRVLARLLTEAKIGATQVVARVEGDSAVIIGGSVHAEQGGFAAGRDQHITTPLRKDEHPTTD
jgi:hypothetical protein